MTSPATATTPARWAVDRIALHAVAAAVALLVLAPLLRPGYVLTIDMVFVPRQPLLWELIAPGSGLPRAVPQDAVVSLLSQVIPGWLLQRLALAGAIYAAALGAGRLVPSQRLLPRIVAGVAYAWSPFLAERLLIGQWGLLLAFGALPWLVAAALGLRAGRPGALPRLILAAGVAAVTPTGGLIALMATAVLTVPARAGGSRRAWWAVGAVLAVNAPWLVAAATTDAGGTSDPAGVAVFAARAENWSGPIGALLGTGGIWNAYAMPASRASALVPVLTLVLLVLAVAGFPELRRRWGGGPAARLALLAGGAFVVASLGAVPGAADMLGLLVGQVPGAGLLRDGHKFLAPYALGLSLCVAVGAERVTQRLALPRFRAVMVALVALPVAMLPDLAWGGGGVLRPVSYPADWQRVAERLDGQDGEVLSLPLSEYRTYAWNHGRTVIDPAPRYFSLDVIGDDRLRVGDVILEGENARAARIRGLLAGGAPVAATGVRWVVIQHDAGAPAPASSLVGLRQVHRGPHLDLYENPAAAPPDRPEGASPRRLGVLAALALAGALLIWAGWRLRRRPTAW